MILNPADLRDPDLLTTKLKEHFDKETDAYDRLGLLVAGSMAVSLARIANHLEGKAGD